MAIPLPLIQLLRQSWAHPRVADAAAEVRQQIRQARISSRLPLGGSVAIAVGSRGIAGIGTMARAAADALRELGFRPFIVAAMGSHGGATPEGQREILADHGITESACGIPVRTDMDVVEIGTNSWNEPVYWDRNAFEADAVVTLARIKPHTDFHGPYESGMVKMLAIGLGKQQGAAIHHRYGVRGLREMVVESAKVVLAKTRFALGLAIIENANHETARIQAVEPEQLLDAEPRLLDQARTWMPSLPFDALDLLVVGELGKNYSGTGMDTNVIGRWFVEGEPEPEKPRITRICCLDVSAASHGNAVGAGLADLVSQPVVDKNDPAKTNLNYFTSCFLLRARIPPAFPTDRDCLEMGLRTCWQPKLDRVRMAIIPNTLELTEIWATAPLLAEASKLPRVEIAAGPREVPFDPQGWLLQEVLFPRSIRSRSAAKPG